MSCWRLVALLLVLFSGLLVRSFAFASAEVVSPGQPTEPTTTAVRLTVVSIPNFYELLNAFQSEYLHIIYFDDGNAEVEFLGDGRQVAPVVLTNMAACLRPTSWLILPHHRRNITWQDCWSGTRESGSTIIQRRLNKIIGLQHFLVLGGENAELSLDVLFCLKYYQTSFFTAPCDGCTNNGVLHYISANEGRNQVHEKVFDNTNYSMRRLRSFNPTSVFFTIMWTMKSVTKAESAEATSDTAIASRVRCDTMTWVAVELHTWRIYCGDSTRIGTINVCMPEKHSLRQFFSAFSPRVILEHVFTQQYEQYVNLGLMEIKAEPCSTCAGVADVIVALIQPSAANMSISMLEFEPILQMRILKAPPALQYSQYLAAVSESTEFSFLSCTSIQDGSVSFRGYHTPFQWGLWTSLVVMLIVTILSITAMNAFHASYGDSNDGVTVHHSLSSSTIVFCAHLLEQCEVPPSLTRLRHFNIVYGIWLMVGLVLVNAYKGIVTTDLTASPAPEYALTFAELVSHQFKLYSNPTEERSWHTAEYRRFLAGNRRASNLEFQLLGVENESLLVSLLIWALGFKAYTEFGFRFFRREAWNFSRTNENDEAGIPLWLHKLNVTVFNTIVLLEDEQGPDLRRFIAQIASYGGGAPEKVAFADWATNIDFLLGEGSRFLPREAICRKGKDTMQDTTAWYVLSQFPRSRVVRHLQSTIHSGIMQKLERDAKASLTKAQLNETSSIPTVENQKNENQEPHFSMDGPQALTMATNVVTIFIIYLPCILFCLLVFCIEIRAMLLYTIHVLKMEVWGQLKRVWLAIAIASWKSCSKCNGLMQKFQKTKARLH